MLLKKFNIAIIGMIFFGCIVFVSCSKSADDDANTVNCDRLETAADAAVIRNGQAHTKATCDSAKAALKAAGECDASYQNEYDSFGSCP